MTFEKILSDVSTNKITAQECLDEISKKEYIKTINYYVHFRDFSKESLNDSQLQQLKAIVDILQILYNSSVGSPITDSEFDSIEELLVDMGIPRLTGSIELNNNDKVAHTYTTLRGTLDKVYYLKPDEVRTNKSRKYLDEWIKSAELLYESKTGEKIDLNKVKIMLQCKFDGVSAILETNDKPLWITRGDTQNNLASNVSHIMSPFNDLYANEKGAGIKFEVMMPEESKDLINELIRDKKYHNSRQIVTATLNSNEADFKVDYLYPVPLRIIHEGEKIESIHPDLIRDFPTEICTFGDRDIIKDFANKHRYAVHNGKHFRTDGCVMTILDKRICEVLGRDRDINNFEVAYKFTEESAISRVKDCEFYVSNFGYVTPILVVNDVILKGNTINHISLSNKERFDELDLHYGDEVKVLYDIIPYAIIDSSCRRVPNGRKIEFIKKCPMCHEILDTSKVQVKCTNPSCPSKLIGRIYNYCETLRIKNIGYQTLETLWQENLLKNGIVSLYKLKKHTYEIQNLDGFGTLKTKKIVREIEAKRKLKDYELFGALGIDGSNIKTFKLIFENVKLDDFLNLIKMKNFKLLSNQLLNIKGIGMSTIGDIVEWFDDPLKRKEIEKLLKEVVLIPTYGENKNSKGDIVFTGCRPDETTKLYLSEKGYNPTDSWSSRAKYLVVPNYNYSSSKVVKANIKNIPIISLYDITKIN